MENAGRSLIIKFYISIKITKTNYSSTLRLCCGATGEATGDETIPRTWQSASRIVISLLDPKNFVDSSRSLILSLTLAPRTYALKKLKFLISKTLPLKLMNNLTLRSLQVACKRSETSNQSQCINRRQRHGKFSLLRPCSLDRRATN